MPRTGDVMILKSDATLKQASQGCSSSASWRGSPFLQTCCVRQLGSTVLCPTASLTLPPALPSLIHPPLQVKDFTAQIQTLDIPGEVKAGYSPIGFVRCGRSACRITGINWKVRLS